MIREYDPHRPSRRLHGAGSAALLAFYVFLGAFAGCDDDDGDSARGDVVCEGDACQCAGPGACEVDCQGACDLACTGSGDCDFACGDACGVRCPGSGACRLRVGDSSTVVCSGSGGCDVRCFGECAVECPGSGVCTLICEQGRRCELTRCDDPVTCDDGVQVCNGACPLSAGPDQPS